MGLGVSVYCNCFEKGRTSEPPVPEDWLGADQYGRVGLCGEYSDPVSAERVYGWLETACEHPHQYLEGDRICNYGFYEVFQRALFNKGCEHFAMLLQAGKEDYFPLEP